MKLSVRNVATTNPPIAVIAIGLRSSEPSPPRNAMGTSPNIVVSAVMRMGRSLTRLALTTASKTLMLFERKRFMQSIKTMALLVTIPPSIAKPIRTYAFMLVPVIRRAHATPMTDSGIVRDL